MLERLRKFTNGDNKHYPPMSSILLLVTFRVMIERLWRFAMGDDNKDNTPM